MSTIVLLTAYNGEKQLPALLESLRTQTDPDFTVLWQDDGSIDGTAELLKQVSREDPRFQPGAEQRKHLGPAGNFLSLIRQADADRLLCCDQDDIWEPEKIAVLKRVMQEAESEYGAEMPILVHSDCSLIDEMGNQVGKSFFAHQGWDPKAVTLPRLLVQNNVTGCALMMNRPLRAMIATHGQAKDLFMHDWFIALTAAAFGRIVFVRQPLTRYRQHEENAIGASKQTLPARALKAFGQRDKAKRRILLTYTHTLVFRRLYQDTLPPEALTLVDAYLATRTKKKIPRVIAVRRLGCTMQSPITRMGQILFG